MVDAEEVVAPDPISGQVHREDGDSNRKEGSGDHRGRQRDEKLRNVNGDSPDGGQNSENGCGDCAAHGCQ
jgi:hypothetical protein